MYPDSDSPKSFLVVHALLARQERVEARVVASEP